MVPHRFAAFSFAGLAAAIAVTSLVPAPHLAGIARALLNPNSGVEKPQMPVFAAEEEKAVAAAAPTSGGTKPASDGAYVVLTFPGTACRHGLCAGLVIRTLRAVHPHNFSNHGHESMVEGIALHPRS
jgi:uncharacterized protein YijF (DUF1287 family)